MEVIGLMFLATVAAMPFESPPDFLGRWVGALPDVVATSLLLMAVSFVFIGPAVLLMTAGWRAERCMLRPLTALGLWWVVLVAESAYLSLVYGDVATRLVYAATLGILELGRTPDLHLPLGAIFVLIGYFVFGRQGVRPVEGRSEPRQAQA